MAFSLIAHTGALSSDGSNVTTPAIDTTGATFIVVAIVLDTGGTATFSDSKSNTYDTSTLTLHNNVSGPKIQLGFVVNPTVGAGHTFTLAAAFAAPSLTVTAWSGNAGSPVDVENGSTANATTIQTGSVIGSLTNSLVIAAAAHNGSASVSVDSGLTISDDEIGSGTAYGNTMAYSIQTTPVSVNPTFTIGGTVQWASSIAVFKSADGVPPVLSSAAASPFVRIRKKFYPGGGWGEYH
jgi:hypothetical protein